MRHLGLLIASICYTLLFASSTFAQLEVLVSDSGDIKGFLTAGGEANYKFPDYQFIEKVGTTTFSRNSSGFHANKISNVGSTRITYNNTGTNDGKINSIGTLPVSYVSSGGDAGKLRSIGQIEFEYYTNSDFRRGKLKKITGTESTLMVKVLVQ
jgi:hypothetical protein